MFLVDCQHVVGFSGRDGYCLVFDVAKSMLGKLGCCIDAFIQIWVCCGMK